MKLKTVLLSIFFLTLLLACKKKVEPQCSPTDFDHYAGNFYCQVTYHYSYDGVTHNEYDKVIRSTVENDTLKIFSYAFPLTDPNQTIFTEGTQFSGSPFARFTFSSDFNSLDIYIDYPSQFSGPSSTIEYSGTKTMLPETVDPHPHLPQLEGNYLLDVTYIQQGSGINNHSVEVLNVTKSGTTMQVGSNSHWFGISHSEFEGTSTNTMIDERIEKSVFWKDDSLFLDYMVIHPVWLGTPDTTHYIYHGTKQ